MTLVKESVFQQHLWYNSIRQECTLKMSEGHKCLWTERQTERKAQRYELNTTYQNSRTKVQNKPSTSHQQTSCPSCTVQNMYHFGILAMCQ